MACSVGGIATIVCLIGATLQGTPKGAADLRAACIHESCLMFSALAPITRETRCRAEACVAALLIHRESRHCLSAESLNESKVAFVSLRIRRPEPEFRVNAETGNKQMFLAGADSMKSPYSACLLGIWITAG